MGLLRVLHGLAGVVGLRLSVAHLDHGTREGASREDARFVADLAASLGLPFDLGAWKPTRAGHFEADARAARLTWLAEIARERGASAVALGHTRDDQAETVLHRIVRGTGTRGLAGIPARRPLAPGVDLVRPLLDVSRAEIRQELERLGQPYREDATNRDVSRTRARIRHDLIPRLEADYNAKVVDAVVRLAGVAAENQRLVDALVESSQAAVVREVGPDRIAFDRLAAASLPAPLAAEVVRKAWRSAGWPERSMTARRWNRIAEGLVLGAERPDVGEGASLRVKPGLMILDRTSPAGDPPGEPIAVLLDGPGTAWVPWAGASLEAAEDPAENEEFDEVLDRDRVAFPLVVRAPAAGERFDPLGMGGRRQRVAEFLRICRVPRDARASAPVLADGEGIVWVVGRRIAERARTTEATTRRLGLRWRDDRGRV